MTLPSTSDTESALNLFILSRFWAAQGLGPPAIPGEQAAEKGGRRDAAVISHTAT